MTKHEFNRMRALANADFLSADGEQELETLFTNFCSIYAAEVDEPLSEQTTIAEAIEGISHDFDK